MRRELLGLELELLVGGRHERLPDLRRERAARDRLAAELGQHRLQLVGVADPHGDRRAAACSRRTRRRRSCRSCRSCRRPGGRRGPRACRCPAVTTLCRIEVSRSASLRRHRPAARRAGSPRHARCARTRPARRRVAGLRQRPVDAHAAVREGRVRARHVERVDGHEAEPDREVRVELAADPERVRRLDDRLRADELRQLRVDGVVGGDHRPRQVDAAEVVALVVRDVPDPVAGVDVDGLRLERRHRRDALVAAPSRGRTA